MRHQNRLKNIQSRSYIRKIIFLRHPFIPQLIKGEKWEVKLCRISKDVYEFWKEYDNAVMFGGSQFVNASQSLSGNIIGGYGVWSVQGVSSEIIEVE